MNTILVDYQRIISNKLTNSKLLAYLYNQRLDLLLLLTISLLVVVSRLPYMEKPFDEDSAANAYGGRLILQGDPLYSSYHPGHHLPAVYYVFALAFSLFGDNAEAVRFFLALWLVPTAGLLYYLSRTISDRKTSFLAAILFILLSADYVLEGHTVEIELFANLPRIAGILLLIKLVERRAPAWPYSLVGLIGAVAILFKAVYVSVLLLAGLVLLSQFYLHRRDKAAVSNLLKQVFWLGVGVLAGFVPVVAYFGLLGLLPRLGLVFTLGQAHVSAEPVSPIYIFLYPLGGLILANAPIFVLGLTGALLIIWNKSRLTLPKTIILLWFFMSLLEAGFSRNAFLHYYQLIVPPLTLLAAQAIIHLYQIGLTYPKIKQAVWMVPALLLLTIGGAYLFGNGGYLYHYLRYKTGQDTYKTFVLHSWPTTGSMFVAIQDIADYIRSHSEPDDRIYIWSDEVQLYYWANRRCALDFIWPIYTELTISPDDQHDMQRRLLAPTTKFIVIAQADPPAWLLDGLAKNYSLVKTISQRQIYQRTDNTAQLSQN